MEILDFFHPIDVEDFASQQTFEDASLIHSVSFYDGTTSSLQNRTIALIGIDDQRNKSNSADIIRKHLYNLKRVDYGNHIVDLGNFSFDYKTKTYETLGFTLSELILNNYIPVILNGSQEITYTQYLAFSYLKQYANLVSFDSRLDFDLKDNDELTASNYLQKLLLSEPSYLFNYSCVGLQYHYADPEMLQFLEKLYFEMHRLGDVRASMNELEPVLRAAQFASWDMGAVRQSDAPGASVASPNGFYSEEACLLSRYAGLSSSLRTIGFYNIDSTKDRDEQTAALCAHMIWYFIDGYVNRYPENPSENKEDFTKFITTSKDNSYQIVFYKSSRTDRWWMEVPLSGDKNSLPYITPCSYNDYLAATREELPDRWLQIVKKLS